GVIPGVQLEPGRRPVLVEDREPRKGPGLPGAEVGAGRVHEDRLDTEVGHGHLRTHDLGTLGLGLLEGLGDVVGRQVDLPDILGGQVGHVSHATGDGGAVTREHEIAAELRARLLGLPPEELAVELATSLHVGGPEIDPAGRSNRGSVTGRHGCSSWCGGTVNRFDVTGGPESSACRAASTEAATATMVRTDSAGYHDRRGT